MPGIDTPQNWTQLKDEDGLEVPVTMHYKANPAEEEGELRDDGSRWSIPWLFPWQYVHQIGRAFLGSHYVDYVEAAGGGDATPYIRRLTPRVMPRLLNRKQERVLFATQIRSLSFHGVPKDGAPIKNLFYPGFTDYHLGKATVLYETLNYDIKSDDQVKEFGIPRDWIGGFPVRYVWVRGDSSSKAFQIPTGQFKYSTGDLVSIFAILPQPSTTYLVTWYRVPVAAMRHRVYNDAAPADKLQLQQAVGCVNKTEFLGCRKGTLRCSSVKPMPVRSAVLDRICDVDIQFEHIDLGDSQDRTLPLPGVADPKPIGHQHLPQFDTVGGSIKWLEITMSGASNFTAMLPNINPHNWMEFSDMFKPPF